MATIIPSTQEALPASELHASLRDPLILEFLDSLRAVGFAEKTLRDKRTILAAFLRWVRQSQLTPEHLGRAHLDSFLVGKSQARHSRWRSARGLLLRFQAALQANRNGSSETVAPVLSASEEVFNRYTEHLLNERGLTRQSVYIYAPFVRAAIEGLTAMAGSPHPRNWNAETISAYLLGRAQNRSSEFTRLLATTLRSFLRFLYLRGETGLDLSLSVGTVRKWSLASVPIYLAPEEVNRILAIPDVGTEGGRRDRAVLLLLARLGLRAGEVVALELGDIHWRTGEVVIRGKGRLVDHLPLPPDVGEALAAYLQEDRHDEGPRRVFVRLNAPRTGLTGPASVGHIVRKFLAKAGIVRSSRGAAHIFRHSLATQMIRHGASIHEIAEVLRHRNPNTTGIYAKVAFEDLRRVARPWPGSGGVR